MFIERFKQLKNNLGYKAFLLTAGVPLLLWIALTSDPHSIFLTITVMSGYIISTLLHRQIVEHFNLVRTISNIFVIVAAAYGVLSNFFDIYPETEIQQDSLTALIVLSFLISFLVMSNIIIYSDESIVYFK